MQHGDFSIATHVHSCLIGFKDTCDNLAKAEGRIKSKLSPGIINDELGRFRLWSGNIGAHRKGKSSLDYRLREASHIRDRVLQLLQSLESVLQEAVEIITGERAPWEDLSDSESDVSDCESRHSEEPTTTELQQLASNMVEINTCLMRLSMAIRNPASHDQFTESTDISVTHFESFDIDHVRGKFPLAEEYLVVRLGKAISRRRQYLRYREEHRKKLEQGLEPQLQAHEFTLPQATQTAPSEVIESTIASSLPLAVKNNPSAAIEIDENDYYEDSLSQTSYASSTNDATRLRPPPLPEAGQKGDLFECPLCFRITSVRQTAAWHKHVYRDLQPYVSLPQ
ncbi:hypothetical protein BKA66DRAFT_582499 [Pyrenochaeta sp. MPI-SDFR-AT-0127]|nr:hypothetical protein BKA66DRAFT_582499 [Pyrenochaeta sp. MPI-SDFR-AT-0127]